MIEEWRDIPGLEHKYQVSNLGSIRSLDRYIPAGRGVKPRLKKGSSMRPSKDKDGYLQIGWPPLIKYSTRKIHRLVMFAFIGYSELGVNHKDGDKQNNILDNLEYSTHSANHKHARNVLRKLVGKDHWNFKGVDTQENRFLIQRYLKFNLERKHISILLGINYKSICHLIKKYAY